MLKLQFWDLPRPARTLIVGMCAVGLAALVGSGFAPGCEDYQASLIYIALALLASSQRLQIHPRLGTMSPGFLFVFAALFQCGTTIAVVAAVVGALGGLLFGATKGRRQSPATTLYAAGSLAAAAWAAGVVFDHLSHTGASARAAAPLVPAAAAVAVYYAISVITIGAISAAVAGRASANLLTEALWLAPVYAAGGAGALTINAAYERLGLATFILGLPIVYIVQRSYAVRAEQTEETLHHLQERARASEKLANLYLQVVEALSTAIEAKDHGTRLHVRRVQRLAVAVARRVGLEGRELEAVEKGAVLHDIGKLAVPDHILRKPSRLSNDEYRMVQEHPVVGEAILRPIDFGADVAAIVRHHHERMDGGGYPDRLLGDRIPVGARVLGVIDVYDALVSDRPYRKAWHSHKAIDYLRQHAGTSFDPDVVEALVDVLEEVDDEHDEAEVHVELPSSVEAALGKSELGPSMPAMDFGSPEPFQRLCELADALAQHAAVHTCVIYEVVPRTGEIVTVCAAGEHADSFAHLRMPLSAGPSGDVARTGCLTIRRPAAEDFSCVASGAPAPITQSVVSAIAVTGRSGPVLAVVSLYSYTDAEVPDSLIVDAVIGAAEAGAISAVPRADALTVELLDYAAFLAALSREVENAAEYGTAIAVMAIEATGHSSPARAEQLSRLAQELRVSGRGHARIVERLAAGGLVGMFPTFSEATVRECVHNFVETARHGALVGPPSQPLELAVGTAVFPEDAASAHGLVTIAEMRMADAFAAAEMESADHLVVPA